MRIIREDLERHRVDILARLVLREIELNEIRAFERRSVHRVRAMLFQPGKNVRQVEDRPRRCANRMRERLEGERAEVER